MMPDFPQAMQERVTCSITAAIQYRVPANILLAIAEKENGKPYTWIKNTNGTADIGSMQFNTRYLADLRKYGITPEDVAQHNCYPYQLAAWRIANHLRHDSGDIWTRAANYHSRTPYYNAIYRADLIQKAAQWENWLRLRFHTYDVAVPTMTKPLSPPSQHYNVAAAHALAAVFCA